MPIQGLVATLSLVMLLLAGSGESRAQEYNALEACIALSPVNEDIHNCMDNYLDMMDASLKNITDFVANSLEGDARAGMESSQQAFVEYRRQNCLWYLEFSSPRTEAEQIAKNCLATMSQQRLRELQSLVRSDDSADEIVSGYYVYGNDRNSFQPCGSRSRYWLEGDNSQVGLAQQKYLSIATSELQVLYATFAGLVDEEAQAPQAHQGIFELKAMVDLRVPTEADCQLPGEALRGGGAEPAPTATISNSSDMPAQTPPQAQEDAEEQLIAYFGGWLVDCSANAGIRTCRLEADLDAAAGLPAAKFSMLREKDQLTSMEVFFDGREIDLPARIRWSIDAFAFGDIVSSEIRVDQSGTRLLVPASPYLKEEILPKMLAGDELVLEVLESVDDESGELYAGSLLGVTKAIQMADDFILEGGS